MELAPTMGALPPIQAAYDQSLLANGAVLAQSLAAPSITSAASFSGTPVQQYGQEQVYNATKLIESTAITPQPSASTLFGSLGLGNSVDVTA